MTAVRVLAATYYFTEQDDVLSANKKQTTLSLCEHVLVIYSFDGVFEY